MLAAKFQDRTHRNVNVKHEILSFTYPSKVGSFVVCCGDFTSLTHIILPLLFKIPAHVVHLTYFKQDLSIKDYTEFNSLYYSTYF